MVNICLKSAALIMKIVKTSLKDCIIIEPNYFGDERGFFMETFHLERYADLANISIPFVQDNHSRSSKGVLRGLHFQINNPQGKLVSCLRGSVFDVAVDINPNSPNYGEYFGIELSEHNQYQLWIPPGYAHGFYVLSDIADFNYKCTDYYFPGDQGGIIWNDKLINIEWPSKNPILSEKDSRNPGLEELNDKK